MNIALTIIGIICMIVGLLALFTSISDVFRLSHTNDKEKKLKLYKEVYISVTVGVISFLILACIICIQ